VCRSVLQQEHVSNTSISLVCSASHERSTRVAVCCSVLQCFAVCCSVLQCVTVYCSVLQCVAVCCSVLQCVPVRCSALQSDTVRYSVLHQVTVHYNMKVPHILQYLRDCLTRPYPVSHQHLRKIRAGCFLVNVYIFHISVPITAIKRMHSNVCIHAQEFRI